MFVRSLDLVDMCLQVIVRNLDLFANHKTIPQKHIDFLFRVYSEEVFRGYRHIKTTVKEDILLLFLNPHVKKVSIRGKLHSEKVLERLQIIGSGITSLNLRKLKVTEEELSSIICSVPHVMQLDLSFTSCTNKTLSCIQKMCPDLKTLSVSYCEGVSDNGVEYLCGIMSLRSLNVMYTNVEPLGVGIILHRMPFLESFKCDYLEETLSEVWYKNSQYNLTEIVYDGMAQNPVKMVKDWTKTFPKLKKLHFEYPVNKRVLQACAGFQHLEEIKIKMSHAFYMDIRVDDVLAPILPISNNLKTLILSCLEIPTVTLIECFRNLENIYLKNVSFTDFKDEDIKVTETKLDTLVIKDTNMEVPNATYKAVAMLISLSKNVTKLNLSHNRSLPHEIFDVILNSMKNLSLVNFSYTSVEMSSLVPFFDIPSMKILCSNCHEDGEDNLIKRLLPNKSCTLNWRLMYDSDDSYANYEEEEEEDYDSDDDDYSNSITDHVISDNCMSSDSERDYRYMHYAVTGDWYDNDYDEHVFDSSDYFYSDVED